MPHAERDGRRIYFEVAGDGPPLVLVRGLARSSRYWGPVLPELAGFRLLLVDNRGVGRSDAVARGVGAGLGFSTEDMARDVVAAMDAAGFGRAHVFGMSLGGMIAQHVALGQPARVDRLVLGCTTPGGRLSHRPGLRARIGQLGTLLDPRGGTHARVDRILARLVSDASLRERPAIAALWRNLARDEPPSLRGVIGQVAAAVRHDAFARLGEILAPTLVITGDDDEVIPHANSKLLAAHIPRAELSVLPGARHDFTTDHPVAAGRTIVEFLRGGAS